MTRLMINKKLIYVVSLVMFVCTFAGCAVETPKEPNGLNVTAVNFIQYDFAKAVGGSIANVSMIVKPGGEYHGFEPSFSDVKKIKDSDVFIYGGGESDEWIHNLLDSGDYDSTISVSLQDCVKLLERDSHGHFHSHSHSGENHNELCHFGNYDEHFWLDFDNAISMIDEICNAYCTADSANSETYKKNAQAYKEQIEILREKALYIKENKQHNTLIVGDKFPYLYLVDFLGVEYLSAISGCGHESDASPSAIIAIIDKIRSENIPVIFCPELSNKSIAQTISDDTGAKVLTLHSCQSISKKDFERGKTYIDFMNENLKYIEEALG